jgi:hypothetical protein
MITIKQAIDSAKRSLMEVYGSIDGSQIEEYALDNQRQHWLVTISFPVFSQDANSLASLIPEKKWKTFSVNTETGEIEAMFVGGAGALVSQ